MRRPRRVRNRSGGGTGAASTILLPVLMGMLCGAAAAQGSPAEPTLTAPHLEYRRADASLIATGGAHLVRAGATLEADRIVYRRPAHTVEAEGGVLFRDGDTVLSADRARMDLETGLGEAEGSVSIYFVKEGVSVSGEDAEKTGRDRFRLTNCTITTCTGDDPAWSLKASTAEFNMGKSVSGRHVRFRIKKVPVLYSPWFWAPALVDKQSGFLFPRFGYSNRNGLTLGLRYYWMAAVNRDMTLHLDGMSERGLGTGAEFRYLEDFGARGTLWAWRIDDRRTDREHVELKGVHEQRFGSKGRGYVRGNYLTNKSSYREFIPNQEDKLRRYLENVAHLSWQPRISRLYATGRIFQNLDGSSRDIPVTAELGSRLFFTAPVSMPLYLDVDLRANRFSRDVGAEGQRFLLRPLLTTTLRIPGLALRPELGWEGRWYDLDGWSEKRPSVEVRRVGVSASSTFFRDFGPVRHYVEPELSYEFSEVRGETPPLFDSRDEAEEVHGATMRLVNRLYVSGAERFRLDIVEGYDIRAERRPWSTLDADLLARAAGGLSLTGRLSYNVYENDIASAQTTLRYTRGRHFVAAGNTFNRADVDTVTLEGEIWPMSSLSTYGRGWYDATGGGLRELEFRLSYHAQCWGVYLEYFSRPEENRFMGNISLVGLGTLGGNSADRR